MDPTEEELARITDIAGARNWAGVTDALWTPLSTLLGDPVRVREVVLVTRPAWDRVIAGPPAPVAPAVVAQPVGGGPGTQGGHRKLKLSAVLDPTLDAEVAVLPQTELAAMYDQYKNRFGAFPTSDTDISLDQFSALAQVIRAGAAPFADFSLFGPYGQRLLRRQTFTAYHFKVFRTGMLLLEAAEAERLDGYGEHIRSFVAQFSEEAWWLVARADHRLRSEHLDRLRRELRGNPQYGFTENNPWGAAFAMAVRDSDFWHKELTTPATLWLSRAKKEAAPSSPSGADRTGARTTKRKRAQRHHQGEDKSRKDAEGRFTHNRKRIEICRSYGRGKCGSEAPQGRCQHNRSHQCDLCLGPHMSSECPNKGSR